MTTLDSPTVAIVPESLTIETSQLPPDEDLLGAPPTPALVRSIAASGVVLPIVLNLPPGQTKYTVIDGRRRLKACRQLKIKEAKALVYSLANTEAAALALVIHATRGENPAAELLAIDHLAADGADEKAICATTGMSCQTYRRRVALKKLSPYLMAAFRSGRLCASVAIRAADLDARGQNDVLSCLRENQRVSSSDVSRIKRASITAIPIAADRPATPNAPPPDPDALTIADLQYLLQHTNVRGGPTIAALRAKIERLVQARSAA